MVRSWGRRSPPAIIELRIAGFRESTRVVAETAEEAREVVLAAREIGAGVEWWSPEVLDDGLLSALGPPDRQSHEAGYDILRWGKVRGDTYDYGRQRAHWESMRVDGFGRGSKAT
ncbi:MAG: hypothetical protein R3B70_14150 [Polyangiaceae bacterium]